MYIHTYIHVLSKHIFKTVSMNHSFNPQDLFPFKKWPVAHALVIYLSSLSSTPKSTPDHLPWNTTHHSTSNGQRYDHPKDDNHDDKPNAPVIYSKQGSFVFFVAVFFWKIVGPCKFSTYNLKTNFGDQLILWKSIKSLPFKNTFFWCHSTGTSHLKQFPQKTLHKTHIYSPENEQLEPENHPYKKETHLTKRNLYSCGFKMLAFRGCVLDVAGTSLCTARFKGSKATTAALLKEGNEGHQERFLKASPSGVGCGYSAGFHTGKNHRFLVGSPFWIHWFHMKNGKILYQQSQIQKWPKNGDVLWRSNIANKKPHPRRFSNIYSLLKVCWGNGNLNQLENFIVIFLALLCDLAWMVEWPLLKGCWWTTQPFGDTKGSRIESPGIHLRNSAIQLEGLSYFLICFLFVFGLFCWSCMSCCVIF